MSGKILYRGVTAGDSHPLAVSTSGEAAKKDRRPSAGCDEALDPRIQDELEKLNKASEDINRLELQLNEARARFRQTLTESTQMLNIQAKKLGGCIEKARPYYDARIKSKEAQTATQNAALRYERAFGQLAAAKEMVYLAEEGFFKKGQPFDPAWQEMLNHATIKVNDAEKERYESQLGHQFTAQLFAESEQKVKRLQKELRRNISKSRPYFELKATVNQQMEEQKVYVSRLENQVLSIKRQYATTLSNLERISDEIHHQRRQTLQTDTLGKRGVGVGAESPVPLADDDSSTPSPVLSPTEPGVSRDDSNKMDVRRKVTDLPAAVKKDVPNVSNVVQTTCESPIVVSNTQTLVSSVTSPLDGAASQGVVHKSVVVGDDNKPCVGVTPTASASVDLVYPPVVLRKPRSIGNESQLRRFTAKPPPPHHIVSSPPGQRPSRVPMVQITPPSASAPTSPIKPDPAQDLNNVNVRDNAELMETIRRQKSKPLGLRASRNSQDDLLEYSDTDSLASGSLASASMLDDEQIQSLMLEMGEYTKFLDKMDAKQAKSWKRLSLPAKLTEVQKNFNLDEFLAEARIVEETESNCGENRAPIAQEEDDLSFEFVEREDEDIETPQDECQHKNISNDSCPAAETTESEDRIQFTTMITEL